METVKPHKLVIRNKGGETDFTNWQNAEILLDDAPLKGVAAIDFSLRIGEYAAVRLEMLADVSLEATIADESIVTEGLVETQPL